MATNPAGSYDRLVQLQLNTPVKDANTGALADAWADLGSPVWARVREGTGQAPVANSSGQVDDYGRPVEIFLRWFSTFSKANTRVVLDGRVMRIVASAETVRREEIKLACVEWAHG